MTMAGTVDWALIAPVAAAMTAGGLIGIERTYHGHPAGFRTHILVCMTSCVLMLAAMHQASWGFVALPEQRLDERVYEATPGTLAALVDEHREVERLLLVGHNPGLEQLVALMHSGQSGDYRGMPPGGIAVLRLPVDVNIEPGIATLTRFWWP